MTKWVAIAGAVLLWSMLLCPPASSAPPVVDCGRSHWVGSWMAAPSDSFGTGDPSLVPQLSIGNQTYRLTITPHRGGSTARLHLTNRTRPVPMQIGRVTVGVQSGGPTVRPGSLREVRFGGSAVVTIPAFSDVMSDPIDLSFNGFQPLSVSVYVPGISVLPTEHFNGNATSYYSLPGAGDRTGELAGGSFPLATTAMPLVSGLDVEAPGTVGAVVAFGDSITDGYVASNVLGTPEDRTAVDRNVRYPDFLQRRLDAAGKPFTVLNAGISGNRVSREGFVPQFGPLGAARIRADAIDKAGVTDIVVLEGINDLGIPIGAPFEDVIAGYTAVIARIHAAGVRVHLGTVLPASNALPNGILTLPLAEPVRQRVNAWIRQQRLSDTVVDFDAALRNPADPTVLDPRYAGKDNLHLSPAGYAALAEAIDLDIFRPRCP